MLSSCRHRTSLHAVKSCTSSWNSSPAVLCKAYYRTTSFTRHRTAKGLKTSCTTPVATNSSRMKYDYRARLHTSITRLEQHASDKTPPLEYATKARGPKVSVITLEDLQSVNPKPSDFSTTSTPVITATEEPVVPKRKRAARTKTIQNDASLETEIITMLPKEIELIVKPESTKKMPRLRAQIMELEATYPDCVLLVRVGEFYEVCLNKSLT